MFVYVDRFILRCEYNYASRLRRVITTGLGYFTGQIDEVVVFNASLPWNAVFALAYQPLIGLSPQQQIVLPVLASYMPNLILLLQFEDWTATDTTGTVGSAFLISDLFSPLSTSDPTSSPLHVFDGPLCYPPPNLAAGNIPTYATAQYSSTFTPSPLSSTPSTACPPGSSTWPGSNYCYYCPIGYSTASPNAGAAACVPCQAGAANNVTGSTGCPIVDPSLPSVTTLYESLTAQNVTVFGVLSYGVLAPTSLSLQWAYGAAPGVSNQLPRLTTPTVPGSIMGRDDFDAIQIQIATLIQLDPTLTNTRMLQAMEYDVASANLTLQLQPLTDFIISGQSPAFVTSGGDPPATPPGAEPPTPPGRTTGRPTATS